MIFGYLALIALAIASLQGFNSFALESYKCPDLETDLLP